MSIRYYTSHFFHIFPFLYHQWYIRYNKLLFFIKGIKYEKGLIAYNSIYIKLYSNSKVSIGSNFTFTSGNCINPLCRNQKGCIVANPYAEILIGTNVGMSSACIWAHKSIIIGNNVLIGGDVILLDSDAHSLDYRDRRISEIDQRHKVNNGIIIGDDVLVGARCIILKGVHIGSRSIIGSGSIVTKSIPCDSIAAGNPCKVIRSSIQATQNDISN